MTVWLVQEYFYHEHFTTYVFASEELARKFVKAEKAVAHSKHYDYVVECKHVQTVEQVTR